MNERWNLDPIYTGFDDENYISDMAAAAETVKELTDFTAGLADTEPLAGLRKGIALQERLSDLIEKLAGYASLRQAANTRDGEAGSQMGQIMTIYSGTAAPLAAFTDWASKLPDLMELVEGDESLKDYRFLFANEKENSRYLLPGIGEAVMAKLHMSGTSAWSDMQQYLTSTVPVTYRGQTINLSAVRNLAYDADPQVRKDAYEAEIACYERIRDAVAFALNSIKLETISDCQLRGYESPLARTLKHSHMEKATLDAMFAAIDGYLPKFWKYLKTKAKLLGYEKGLPWYELFAPMGKSSTKFTAEDAREYLVNLFAGFDKELSNMVATAFDEAWIDFYPRDGKAGGAFCADVNCIGQSRILTNFDGQFGDVLTLAHELGHRWCSHLGTLNRKSYFQGTPCASFG